MGVHLKIRNIFCLLCSAKALAVKSQTYHLFKSHITGGGVNPRTIPKLKRTFFESHSGLVPGPIIVMVHHESIIVPPQMVV
jgi:hypothetical protein